MDYQAQLDAFAAGNVAQPAAQPVVEETYGIFNDPQFFEPRFASGEIHPLLREKLLDEPLWTSPVPGPAKRYMNYYNEQRAKEGTLHRDGMMILRKQTVTRMPWTDVKGQELDDIDDGRRAYG